MYKRDDLAKWLEEALKISNGSASIVQVCRIVWEKHEQDLKSSGDLFFTWQYDIRWAATKLRKIGIMRPEHSSSRGLWELK